MSRICLFVVVVVIFKKIVRNSKERCRKSGNLSIGTRRCEGFNCSLEFNLRTRVSSVQVIKSEIMSRLSRDGSEMKRLICSVCNETEVSHLHILFVCTQKLIFFFLKSRAYTTCLVCGLVKMQASGGKKNNLDIL